MENFPNGKKCLKLIANTGQFFAEARDICRKAGGLLPVPENEAENLKWKTLSEAANIEYLVLGLYGHDEG